MNGCLLGVISVLFGDCFTCWRVYSDLRYGILGLFMGFD